MADWYIQAEMLLENEFYPLPINFSLFFFMMMFNNNNYYYSQSLLRRYSWPRIALNALIISLNSSSNMRYALLLILLVSEDTEAWKIRESCLKITQMMRPPEFLYGISTSYICMGTVSLLISNEIK